jgi:tetratricopeptide (TPR) repeat protein
MNMEARDNTDQVLTSSEEITLPTYRLLGENRNPVFHSQYGVAHIYPYTLQDEIASAPTEVTYRALILENRYLRVTILPELGGRVFSLYDKISEREVFYKNTTVKFSPLAIRGAFFSGGLEFSFPVAHAPTTAENVNWDFQHHKEGSASIIIGGQEHMSGLRWTIKLSLFPDRCALAQDVQLHNPTPLPGRYHYWTNASTDSDDQTEFIYPLQRVRSYEFAGTASWPVARLDPIISEPGLPGMEGVPMWPAERLHEAINFRWEKDMLAQVSIFGRDVTWDYFGAWQHSSNIGYAHFARYQDVSGMKLWSWGQSEVGIVNQSALMDDGSLYAETQCGAMETQLDFAFLQPGETKTWREWWLPLRDLGGLTCASAELGARLNLGVGEDADSITLTAGICPVIEVPSAQIELSIPGETLLQETATISPKQPWLKEISVEAQLLSVHPLTLTVRDDQGKPLLDYTHSSEPYDGEFIEAETTPHPDTAADFYQLGLKHENFDNRAQALESYWQAIRTSEDHGPSHFQLGLMLLKSADFKGASYHFRWAADLGISSALYYLGLLSWYRGDTDAAQEYYESVPGDDSMSSIALRGLVAIAFKGKRWSDAVQLLKLAQPDDEEFTSANTILAMALHRAGQVDEAHREFQRVLSQDPLNLLALNELAALETSSENSYHSKLHRLLADDQQYVLDLACLYLDVGLSQEAFNILATAADNWEYPLLFYLSAYLHEVEAEAATLRGRGRETEPDMVFPSRLWEIIALQDAIAEDPEDDRAKYYLGNFYYARQRYEEAMQLWEDALEGLNSFDVIHRNLGLAYWQQKDDLVKATQFFENALELNPENQDLYLHLDDLYRLQGNTSKRGELLSAMETIDPIREDLRKRIIAIMVDLGQHERALAIITSEEFVPLEMDQSFHLVYVRALLKRAEAHLEAGRIEDAIADYHKALEYPQNQGVGKPIKMGNAEILYRLGCAYELTGDYRQAVRAWQEAASEHHAFGEQLYPYLQKSLDKLGRFSELGFTG